VGSATGRHRFGHDPREVAGAAADVEHPVRWPGAAGGGRPGEDTPPTPGEEDGGEHLMAAALPDEDAGRPPSEPSAGVERSWRPTLTTPVG
jgi:hypothetical protein